MASRHVRSVAALVAAAGLVAAGCSSSEKADEDEPAPDATVVMSSATGPRGAWAGEVEGTSAFVAIVTDGEQVLAYVCADGTVSEWFSGPASGTDLVLRSASGALLAAALDGGATGTLTLADGTAHGYEAAAVSEPALYRAEAGAPEARLLAGWVRLPTGETRGSLVQVPNGPSPAPGLTAPTLAQPPVASTAPGPATLVAPQPAPALVLEGVVLGGALAQPTPMTPDTLGAPTANRAAFRWAGLGDSYGAGEGNPERPIADPNEVESFAGLRWGDDASTFVPFPGGSLASDAVTCHRSDEAAVPKANRALQALYPDVAFSLAFVACSGAQTKELTEAGYLGPGTRPQSNLGLAKVAQPAQLDRVETFADEKGGLDALYVSIGGNDLGFADIVTDCLSPVVLEGCKSKWEPLLPARLQALGASLQGVKEEIEERFGAVPVFASLYPNPLSDGSGGVCQGTDYDEHGEVGVGGFDDFLQDNVTPAEASFGFDLPFRMNQVVSAPGWGTVDAPFTGHGVCTDTPFANLNSQGLRTQGRDLDGGPFNGGPFVISAGFMHPNDAGYAAMAEALVTKLRPVVDRTIVAGLQPPTGTRIAAATANQAITVRWNDRATSENAYEVEVAPARPQDVARMVYPTGSTRLAGGAYVERVAGADLQEYRHVANGSGLFKYRVRACNTALRGEKCGAFGPQATGANFAPALPAGFASRTATRPEGQLSVPTLSITWTAQPEALEYVVRAPSPSSDVRTGTPSFQIPFALVANADVKVSACNRVGCSPFVSALAAANAPQPASSTTRPPSTTTTTKPKIGGTTTTTRPQ